MIDKLKEASIEGDDSKDQTTGKLKNLLMFFIGVGIIVFVVPEVLVQVVGEDTNGDGVLDTNDLFTPNTNTIFDYLDGTPDNPGTPSTPQNTCPPGSNNVGTGNTVVCWDGSQYVNPITTTTTTTTTTGTNTSNQNVTAVISAVFNTLLWIVRICMILACVAIGVKMSLARI